jgi:hypothetical protein
VNRRAHQLVLRELSRKLSRFDCFGSRSEKHNPSRRGLKVLQAHTAITQRRDGEIAQLRQFVTHHAEKSSPRPRRELKPLAMKTLLLPIALIVLVASAPLAEAKPKYQVRRADGRFAPWWFHFGLPIVPRERCSATPEKFRVIMGDGYRAMDASSPITGRY